MLSALTKNVKHSKQYLHNNVNMTLQNRINKLFDEAPEKKAIELARFAKITRATVSAWRNGGTNKITGENAFAVARFFGVNPEWVQTGKGSKKLLQTKEDHPGYKITEKQKKFIELFESLPQKEQDKLFEELEKKTSYFNEIYEDLKRRKA